LRAPPNSDSVARGSAETTNGRKASNHIDLHTVKIGINYRF
jgi:opacity protein-like surface antigen